MRTVGLDINDLVKFAKVVVGLSDAFDNEETVKGAKDLFEVFKAEVRDLYIKSHMEKDERDFLIQIASELRDARITEIEEMLSEEDEDDE